MPISFETYALSVFRDVVANVTEHKLERFFRLFATEIAQHYPVLSSRAGVFGRFKKAVAELRPGGLELARRVFTLERMDRARLRQRGERHVEDANAHVIAFERSWLFARLDELGRSDNPVDLVIWCMLQSGCRLIEILHTAEFTETQGGLVSVTGLVKVVKSKMGESKQKSVVKPLLSVPFRVFIAQLRKVRAWSSPRIGDRGLSLKQITNLFNAQINKRIRNLFGERSTSHTMRKIYGSASYQMYADPTTMSYNSWLERVLGHSHLATSLSYSNVHVT